MRAAKAQKGRYRFFVVFQHYPYFRKSGPCSYGEYEFWHGTFDALGVDFAVCDENGSSYGACLFSVEGENMTLRYISPSGKVRDAVSVRRRQRYGCFGTRHHNPKTLEYMAVPKKNEECDLASVPTGGGD